MWPWVLDHVTMGSISCDLSWCFFFYISPRGSCWWVHLLRSQSVPLIQTVSEERYMYVCAWGNTVYIVLLALFCKRWISRPGSWCWGAPGTRLWCRGQGMRLLSARVEVYVPRQGYLGVVWRLVYVANCRLLVSTNWNVSRLSIVAGWWSHVESRVKCALKRRTLCRWVCGAVNHSI